MSNQVQLGFIEDPGTYWTIIRLALGAAVFGRGISWAGYSKLGQVSTTVGIYTMIGSVIGFIITNSMVSLNRG
jgi:hypothetical protein